MSKRNYPIRDFSFNYNATEDSTANGFVSLSDPIPPGWTFFSGNVHCITTVTTAGGAGQFPLTTDAIFLTSDIQESLLVGGRYFSIPFFAIPPRQFNPNQAPFGITIANGPVLTGEFVVFGQYVIITE